MNSSSATLVLAAHLAVLSSISSGGFPTVLPDVHDFAVAKGWVTDQEFANFFAVSQVTPGPNMILMMSFAGLKVGRIPAAIAAALATFAPPCAMYSLVPVMGPFPRPAVAAHCAAWPCSTDRRARHCRRLCYGSFRRHRVAEWSDHRCRSGTDARHAAQSALDPDRRRSIGRVGTSVTASSMKT
jgi:Chromate transporter